MRLYRAVSQAELDDITASGVFRQDGDSFVFGKWFALSYQNAATWSRWFAGRDGLRYYVVETEVAASIASQLTVKENLDNIVSAVFLTEIQFSELAILSVSQALSGN
ncbi:MAG: hypothetical protein ACRYFS_12040 [Janthinobacterium lividum]